MILVLAATACSPSNTGVHASVSCDSSWTGIGAGDTCDQACESMPSNFGKTDNTQCSANTIGPNGAGLPCTSSFVTDGVRGCCLGVNGSFEGDGNNIVFSECTSLLTDAGTP